MTKFGCGQGCKSVIDCEDRLAFGRGELDKSNHWSIPCAKCAREYDKNFKPTKECWPVPTLKPDIENLEIKIPEHLKYFGTFGGVLTIRPISTNKPTRCVIWHMSKRSVYISLEFGFEIEEVILA